MAGNDYFNIDMTKSNDLKTSTRLIGRLPYNETPNFTPIQSVRSSELLLNARRDSHSPSIRSSSVDNCYGPSFRLSMEGYNVQSQNSSDVFIKPSRSGEFPLQPSRSGVYSFRRSNHDYGFDHDNFGHFRRSYSPEYLGRNLPSSHRSMDDSNNVSAIEHTNNIFNNTRSQFPPVEQHQKKNSKKKKRNNQLPNVVRNNSKPDVQGPVVHSLPLLPSPQPVSETSDNKFDFSKTSDNLTPSKEYTRITFIPSIRLDKSLPKLMVLDLNGTLVCRIKTGRIILRPYINEFVDYIFNNGFYVMVWSSAQPYNVNKMVTAIFGRYEASLIEVWDRDSFGLSTQQYHTKTLTIKNLEKIWEKLNKLNGKPRWDQLNTVLIDDSMKKAQLQPFNSIHLTEFDKCRADKGNDRELFDVIPYLEELRYQSNVSAYIKEFPHKSKKLSSKESYSYDNDDPSFHKTITNLNSDIKEGMSLNDSSSNSYSRRTITYDVVPNEDLPKNVNTSIGSNRKMPSRNVQEKSNDQCKVS